MLFLKTTLCENSEIPSKYLAFLKTKHQIISYVFLIWVSFSFCQKIVSSTLLHLKTQEMFLFL